MGTPVTLNKTREERRGWRKGPKGKPRAGVPRAGDRIIVSERAPNRKRQQQREKRAAYARADALRDMMAAGVSKADIALAVSKQAMDVEGR